MLLYFNAYLDLDSERTHDESAKPIPWSKMARYLDFYDYPDEICNDFFYLLKAMDHANLERISADIKRSFDASQKK